MYRYWQRALRDIAANKFLNTVTVVTISLSVLIVSAFGLLAVNFGDLIEKWRHGVRILVYLKAETSVENRRLLESRIRRLEGVSGIEFVSKEEGLSRMKARVRSLEAVLADLENNPLPDAFEINPEASALDPGRIEEIVKAIEKMESVEEVSYGRVWLNRISGLMNLFRLAGVAVGALFVVAAVFIVANTIRLVLYSRQQEIEIMRLIGATDRFIKMPFYFQGMIQGLFGGVLGLGVLYGLFRVASASVGEYLPIGVGGGRYFSFLMVSSIAGGAMLAGWIGCYLSLKGFLRH